MANLWGIVQEVASMTRHVQELRAELDKVTASSDKFRDEVRERLNSMETRIRLLEHGQKETIRAEIAVAMSEFVVRYERERAAEAQRRLTE